MNSTTLLLCRCHLEPPLSFAVDVLYGSDNDDNDDDSTESSNKVDEDEDDEDDDFTAPSRYGKCSTSGVFK